MLDAVVESLVEIFDEFHSQKSKMDGLQGMRENIKRGWRAGGLAILGYRLTKQVVGMRDGQPITKSKLEPDPKHFPTVQAYLKGRARGESHKALMDSLSKKVPYTTLVYIEESVLVYAGHTLWNRHNEVIDGQYVGGQRFRNADQWLIVRDTHDAMTTDDEAYAFLHQRESARAQCKRLRRNNYLLAGLLRCRCGANVDGDGGYYRCHVRCGACAIKQEALEEAVLAILCQEFLTPETIEALKAEIDRELASKSENSDRFLVQLNDELRQIERQITELVGLVTQVNHKRPLLERLDKLEEERQGVESKLREQEALQEPAPVLDLSDASVKQFLSALQRGLQESDAEKKKALLRNVVQYGVFDGEQLTLHPALARLTGVKLASPRGLLGASCASPWRAVAHATFKTAPSGFSQTPPEFSSPTVNLVLGAAEAQALGGVV